MINTPDADETSMDQEGNLPSSDTSSTVKPQRPEREKKSPYAFEEVRSTIWKEVGSIIPKGKHTYCKRVDIPEIGTVKVILDRVSEEEIRIRMEGDGRINQQSGRFEGGFGHASLCVRYANGNTSKEGGYELADDGRLDPRNKNYAIPRHVTYAFEDNSTTAKDGRVVRVKSPGERGRVREGEEAHAHMKNRYSEKDIERVLSVAIQALAYLKTS